MAEPGQDDQDGLKKKLVRRIALAGMAAVVLLGGLAVFEHYLNEEVRPAATPVPPPAATVVAPPPAEEKKEAQDFFAHHQCTSPYFSEIPEEFIAFLQTERDHPDDFAFLAELAHYEWVEMAVAVSNELTPYPINPPDDLANCTLVLSPVAWPLAYQYPVHKISPSFLPSEPPAQPSFLIVYRNTEEDVQFLEITPMTYRLLAIIQDNPEANASDCLAKIAAEMQHPQPDVIIAGGLQILRDLVTKTIVTVVG